MTCHTTRSNLSSNLRLCGLSLATLLGVGASGWVHAATLGEVLDMARASDPIYAAAVAGEQAGQEKRVQGRAAMLPNVAITGNLRQNREQGQGLVGTRSYSSGAVALNVNQPLFRRANLLAGEQGETQATLAGQQLRLAEQDLLLRVARGYFEVLQAQDALASLGAQKDAFAQQLAQAKRSFEVGMSPVTDVNEARARHDLTAAQELTARNDVELKRRTLERMIDKPLPALAALDDGPIVELMTPAAMGSLVERAPQQAWPVAIAQTQATAAAQEVARQEAGHLPTVDLVASAGETRNANYGTIGNNSLRQANIGVELSLPIYQGGATSSRVREAVANLERARQEAESARRQALLDARQAMLGATNGVALQKALREAVASGQTQLRSSQRGMEVGVRTRVDVLNAEQQLHATRRDLAAARYQTVLSTLQLKAASGLLAEADLRGLDKLLK